MLLDTQENRLVVDLFRALGILLVICFHVVIGLAVLVNGQDLTAFVQMMPGIFNIFWQALGSEIIFLFSGFLLSYLLIREYRKTGTIDVAQFYLRRLSRILPLYFVAIAGYSVARDYHFWDLVLNLLFVSTLFSARTIVPVGWSLELLMQSYLLLPFIALLFLKIGRPVALCIIAIVVLLAIRYFAFAADPVSYQTPIYAYFTGTELSPTMKKTYELLWYRATPFFTGFLLAYLVIDNGSGLRAAFAKTGVALTVFGLSLALILGSGFVPVHDPTSVIYRMTGEHFWLWFWTLQRFVFSVGISLLVLCFWYGRTAIFSAARQFAGLSFWQQVSTNIYAIYLGHPAVLIPAAAIAFRTADREGLAPVHIAEVITTIVVATSFALMFAIMLTRYIEIPAQRWIRSRFNRSS